MLSPTLTLVPVPTAAFVIEAGVIPPATPEAEAETVPERVRSTLVGAANTLRDRNTLIILLIAIGAMIGGIFLYLVLRRR